MLWFIIIIVNDHTVIGNLAPQADFALSGLAQLADCNLCQVKKCKNWPITRELLAIERNEIKFGTRVAVNDPLSDRWLNGSIK